MRYHESRISIGDFARIQSGFAFSSNDWSDDGYPVIKINNVRHGKVSLDSCSYVSEPLPEGAERHRLARGDLLITLTGEIGAIGIVDQAFPMYLNQRVGRIQITDTSKATLRFLALLLSEVSLRQEMSSHAKGNAQLNISPSSIEDLSVSLPPLEEQGRIVDLAASVDSYIAALEQQADTARTVRHAVLLELLSSRGDDWTETSLGEVAEIVMGISPPSSTYNTERNGLPFIQGSGEFGTQFPVPVKWCSSPSKIAEVGDVLLSVRAPVGDTNTANQRISVGRGLAVIRARSGSITPFLRLLLQANVDGLISNSGSGMFASITSTNLRRYRIDVPPLEEQKLIVDLVSSIDDVIQTTEQTVVDAKNIRSGLLSELLSGEHEIPESYDRLLGVA